MRVQLDAIPGAAMHRIDSDVPNVSDANGGVHRYGIRTFELSGRDVSMKCVSRRSFLAQTFVVSGSMVAAATAVAQQPAGEPAVRIARNETLATNPSSHPLDPALQIARQSLTHIRDSVTDYTAIMIKRERIGSTLGEHEFMFTKIRNRKIQDGQLKAPFSVYLSFLKPASVKGREVIFVENRNSGNMVAHEGGFKGRFLPTVDLDPKGMLAMSGQRYPITEMGIENLVVKLIEKGERDRQHGECNVQFSKGAKVGGRACTVLTVSHPVARAYFDFHIAQIFIDDELNIPVRYAAYTWPTTEGGEAELIEEYTYQDVKLNVGLVDADFDRKNSAYNF